MKSISPPLLLSLLNVDGGGEDREVVKKPEARPEVERRQVKRWEPAEPVIDTKIITVNKVVRNTLIKGQKDN